MVNSDTNERVVITGLGVLAPNGHGLDAYEAALRGGVSGIRFIPKLAEQNFACQVGGVPQGVDEIKGAYLGADDLLAMNDAMIYAAIAGIDCWRDAGLRAIGPDAAVDWDTGAIIGTGIGGMQTIGERLIPTVDKGRVRRLGSTMVEQVMCSAVSAKLGGLLAVMSAGAYGMAMSSNYNTRPRVAEVMVDGAQVHLIRRRETIEELYALESVLP